MMSRINLLPEELRKDPAVELKRVLRTAIITTVIASLVLAFITLYANNHFKAKEIDHIKAEIEATKPLVTKVETLQAEIKVNNRKITTYRNLLNKPVAWTNIIGDINLSMPRDLWLTEVSAVSVQKEVKKENQEEVVKVNESFAVLKGYAPSLSSIGVFIINLNHISSIEDVTLLVAREKKDAPSYLMDFEIKAQIKTYQEGGED